MADKDTLPSKGIPFFAIVDSSGVAVGGTATKEQLGQRGMQSLCQVDALGVTTDTVSMLALAGRGIRPFCVVNETGVDPTTSATIAQLAARGIRGLCPVDSSGIAQGGTATIPELARKGIGYFCPLDESGNATTVGTPTLQLTPNSMLDSAIVGDDVGTASITGAYTGTPSYSLSVSAGGKYSINSSTGLVEVAATLSAGTDSITIAVSGVTPAVANRSFNITVTSASGTAGQPIGLLLTLTKAA